MNRLLSVLFWLFLALDIALLGLWFVLGLAAAKPSHTPLLNLLGFFALIVAVCVGLIGWRGDRLRSPGAIDSPMSREGAFLANNLVFAAFAFVVLLGTVIGLDGRPPVSPASP